MRHIPILVMIYRRDDIQRSGNKEERERGYYDANDVPVSQRLFPRCEFLRDVVSEREEFLDGLCTGIC